MLAENVCPMQLLIISYKCNFVDRTLNIPGGSFKQQDAFLDSHAEETDLLAFNGCLGSVSLSSESSKPR